MNATPVAWSSFARRGKEFAERIRRGETFLILHGTELLAVVRPVEPNETFTIRKERT